MKHHDELGTVQVYTGEGKGKTTAAFGLALRALGHGQRVLIVQFMKGSKEYGEYKAIQSYANAEIHLVGRDCFVNRDAPEAVDIEMAQEGFQTAREGVTSSEFDLVILDEINVALDFNLIELEQVIELIQDKPYHTELVMTGRYAPEQLLELADLVSEIKEIKHHYQKGITARKGVEH